MASKLILVVDDDTQLRFTFSSILEKGGYRAQTCENPSDVISLLGSETFDLVFLDLNMPGMSGIEVLQKIKELFPELPVLILTAHASLETAIQAIRLGARDYLIKPVDPAQLLDRVADVLDEINQPIRKREIVGQIQDLLGELQKIEGGEATPTRLLATVPPTDTARMLKRGPFTLDLHARHVTLDGRYLPITDINFDYLVTLIRYAPKPVPYKVLVKESQGYETAMIEAKGLARWRIHELRKIVEANSSSPQLIVTVRGRGYRLAI